jgi:hypothetical protein
VVLSLNVAVAQSQATSSGQFRLYQNDNWVAPDGAVNVCATFESPFVGLVLPNNTARDPECTGLDTTLVVPDRVQPVKSPVSNPPLTITLPPPPEPVTVSE